jgi:hypothetical protein
METKITCDVQDRTSVNVGHETDRSFPAGQDVFLARPEILSDSASAGAAAENIFIVPKAAAEQVTVDPRAIGNIVTRQTALNGAVGHVENGAILLKASSADDPGLSIYVRSLAGGILSFVHEGTASGGAKEGAVLVKFFKPDPENYYRDELLKQEEIVTEIRPTAEILQIPPGTDKIVIMKQGRSTLDIRMSNVIVIPGIEIADPGTQIAVTQQPKEEEPESSGPQVSDPEERKDISDDLTPVFADVRTVISPPEKGKVYLGAYLGNNVRREDVLGFETGTGAPLNFIVSFWSVPPAGGIPFGVDESIFNSGEKTLFIKEQPGNWANNDPNEPDKIIPFSEIVSQLEGRSGTYFEKYVDFAEWAKRFEKPVFISLGHEMNGHWYSWGSTSTTPEQYKKYYRLVHGLMLEKGATNVTFVFNPDLKADSPIKDYDSYFPGAEYVDWIGLDVYQGRNPEKRGQDGHVGRWENADTLFEGGVKEIRDNPLYRGLPIMIAEYGRNRQSLEFPDDPDGPELATITSAFEYVFNPDSGVAAIVYFDIDQQDGKWALKDKNLDEFRAVLGKHKANLSSVALSGQKDGTGKVLTEKEPAPK